MKAVVNLWKNTKWGKWVIIVAALFVVGICGNISNALSTPVKPAATAITKVSPPQATNTPKPTPSAAQHITSLINDAIDSYGGKVKNLGFMISDSQGNAVSGNTAPDVEISIDNFINDDQVKMIDFYLFKKLYTTQGLTITDIRVQIDSTCQDQYGKTFACRISLASLSKSTADLFQWDNLDFSSAWKDYDNTDIDTTIPLNN